MKNYFSLLDPLRFGAALGVAVFHLMFYSWAGASIGAPQGFEQLFAADVQFPNAAPYTETSVEVRALLLPPAVLVFRKIPIVLS